MSKHSTPAHQPEHPVGSAGVAGNSPAPNAPTRMDAFLDALADEDNLTADLALHLVDDEGKTKS